MYSDLGNPFFAFVSFTFSNDRPVLSTQFVILTVYEGKYGFIFQDERWKPDPHYLLKKDPGGQTLSLHLGKVLQYIRCSL